MPYSAGRDRGVTTRPGSPYAGARTWCRSAPTPARASSLCDCSQRGARCFVEIVGGTRRGGSRGGRPQVSGGVVLGGGGAGRRAVGSRGLGGGSGGGGASPPGGSANPTARRRLRWTS